MNHDCSIYPLDVTTTVSGVDNCSSDIASLTTLIDAAWEISSCDLSSDLSGDLSISDTSIDPSPSPDLDLDLSEFSDRASLSDCSVRGSLCVIE